jgi:hypothetical protein
MSHVTFTVEEENLICAFYADSRLTVINGILTAVSHFEEQELCEIAFSVIDKLASMDDESFSKLVLNPAYDSDD